MWYLTGTEWAANLSAIKADTSKDTAKFYIVDTKAIYVIYSGTEYPM